MTSGAGAGAPGAGTTSGGFPVRVALEGAGWRAAMACGAVVLVAAGIMVIARAGRLPVMSARYERSRGSERPAAPVPAARAAAGSGLWEALSAGEDPTDRAP